MDITSGLNDPQKEAVKTLNGPLLILAGAGSGKTKTLTHRIANLINNGVNPNAILAVTFTNKAAKEMRDRLFKLVANNAAEAPRNFMPYMGTFHSVCVKILRIEHEAAGLDPNFTIYDTDDQLSLVKRCIKKLKIDDKSIKPSAVLSIISKCKNEGTSPDEYAAKNFYPTQKQIAKIYKSYEAEKSEAHSLDFDDLLIEVLHLFKNNSEIRNKWRNRFEHILIDEYQDTNKIQYHLIKMLVNDAENICVVGDDWQSIYSWRGADFTNILNFEKDFPGAKVIKLEQNYRSTANILEASQKIISNNKTRTDKMLFTEASKGSPITIEGLIDETAEAGYVARKILQMSNGQNYSDFAVLYRTNAQSYAFEKAFIASKIPYKIIGGIRFYDRREVKDVLSILKLLVNPRDTISLERIIKNVISGIGDVGLTKIVDAINYSSEKNPFSNLEVDLTPKAKTSLDKLSRFIITTDLLQAPARIIEKVVSYFNFETLLKDGTPSGEEHIANLAVLVGNAELYQTLDEFLADATLMSSADESSDKNSVTLMTMHAAKGLEFPVVFLVGMEDGLFPSSRADTEASMEEERRLAYVGMTRAMRDLFMTYANSRYSFGGRNYSMPSRFLTELGYNPYGSEDYADEDADGFIDDPFPDDLPIFE